jgi:hypothetical protein
VEAPPAFACGTVLLVVGEANSAADQAMTSRLRGLGCTVAAVDDTVLTAADATGKSLALISETAVPGQTKDKLKAVTVGLIDMQAALLDDLGFNRNVIGVDWAQSAAELEVIIVDPSHPLSGNLSGTVALFTAPSPAAWAVPDGTGVIRVAAQPNTPAHLLVFAFDTGGKMSGTFVAPGRRVAFPLGRDSVLKFSASGWALFDAAVRWAASH